MKHDTLLVAKYNVPGPRYTSYPTVPYWDADSFSPSGWTDSLTKGLRSAKGKVGLGTSTSICHPSRGGSEDGRATIDPRTKKVGGKKSSGISLYIHLPFCKSMCTFCGCTKRITKNHLVERPYIKALLKELKLYTEVLGHRPVIKQLHLGGGTPTFFSAENLEDLLIGIFKLADKAEKAEFSFEGHPNNTTKDILRCSIAMVLPG